MPHRRAEINTVNGTVKATGQRIKVYSVAFMKQNVIGEYNKEYYELYGTLENALLDIHEYIEHEWIPTRSKTDANKERSII